METVSKIDSFKIPFSLQQKCGMSRPHSQNYGITQAKFLAPSLRNEVSYVLPLLNVFTCLGSEYMEVVKLPV